MGTDLIQFDEPLQVLQKTNLLGKELTVYGTPDEPLFLAKEVAGWIEYELSSVNKMVNMVDDDEKVRKIIPTLGGNQEMWTLTEDGLYEILMQSRKPVAKQFKSGVKKILHELRTKGSVQTLTRKELALMVVKAEEEKERLQLENKQQQMEIVSLTSKTELQADTIRQQSKELVESRDKVQKYNETMSTNELFTTTKIADCFGISASKLNKILVSLKIQYKQSGCYHLFSEYKTWKGNILAEIKPNPYHRQDGSHGTRDGLYWTIHGREFLLVDKAEKIKALIPLVKV